MFERNNKKKQIGRQKLSLRIWKIIGKKIYFEDALTKRISFQQFLLRKKRIFLISTNAQNNDSFFCSPLLNIKSWWCIFYIFLHVANLVVPTATTMSTTTTTTKEKRQWIKLTKVIREFDYWVRDRTRVLTIYWFIYLKKIEHTESRLDKATGGIV